MPFRTIELGALSLVVVLRDQSRVHKMVQGARRLLNGHSGAVVDDGKTHRRPASGSPDDTPPADRAAVLASVDEIEWYHSVDLGDGVVTKGMFDHTPLLQHYGLPARMDGMRALDVATMDGFWAFEFERRGAKEVVALDIDRVGDLDLNPSVRQELTPDDLAASTKTGFHYAKRALDSRVERNTLSVYQLSPERLGTFDFVFVGSLLLHLTDPIKALQNVASVTTGHAIIAEAFHPALPRQFVSYEGGAHRSVWWCFSESALEHMIKDAGFATVERIGKMDVPARVGPPVAHVVFRAHK